MAKMSETSSIIVEFYGDDRTMVNEAQSKLGSNDRCDTGCGTGVVDLMVCSVPGAVVGWR